MRLSGRVRGVQLYGITGISRRGSLNSAAVVASISTINIDHVLNFECVPAKLFLSDKLVRFGSF